MRIKISTKRSAGAQIPPSINMSSAVEKLNAFAKINKEQPMDAPIPMKKRGEIEYIILVADLDKKR